MCYVFTKVNRVVTTSVLQFDVCSKERYKIWLMPAFLWDNGIFTFLLTVKHYSCYQNNLKKGHSSLFFYFWVMLIWCSFTLLAYTYPQNNRVCFLRFTKLLSVINAYKNTSNLLCASHVVIENKSRLNFQTWKDVILEFHFKYIIKKHTVVLVLQLNK